MRGSGLQFSDLTIDNDGDFGPTITSSRGKITISESFGEVTIDGERLPVLDTPRWRRKNFFF